MEAFWTNPKTVIGRIDAEYYRREFVSAATRLQTNCDTRPFSRLWREHNRIYIGIAGFQDIEDESAYTPYLRPVDITLDGQIQYYSLPWCLLHWLDDWAKVGCAKPGDLLIEVKGNTRKAAVVDERIPGNCIVSGSSYRIQLKAGFDPYFYQAFFTSNTGQLLKRRVTSNTTINYIDPDSFKRFQVPVVEENNQRAIGNKVRKAERLRELASYWSRLATEKLNEQTVEFEVKPSQSTWLAVGELNERMDTQPYRTHFLSLENALRRSGAARLGKIAKVTGGDPVSSDGFRSEGVPLVRIRDIQPEGFATPDVHVSHSYFASRQACAARPFRIVLGMDGEFRAQFFIESDLPRLINQRVAIIDCEGIRPELLVAWLNRPEGQLQLARWTVQTTVAHTSLSHIRNLLIPRLADIEEDALADALLRAREADTEAVLLIKGARAAVESLIDGTLDESALLAEGEAIEQWLADNPSPHETGKP